MSYFYMKEISNKMLKGKRKKQALFDYVRKRISIRIL